jgi:dihydrodipicolinate synthase/N-acetylneuraminate lyase
MKSNIACSSAFCGGSTFVSMFSCFLPERICSRADAFVVSIFGFDGCGVDDET